jgi:hypothetical protein
MVCVFLYYNHYYLPISALFLRRVCGRICGRICGVFAASLIFKIVTLSHRCGVAAFSHLGRGYLPRVSKYFLQASTPIAIAI